MRFYFCFLCFLCCLLSSSFSNSLDPLEQAFGITEETEKPSFSLEDWFSYQNSDESLGWHRFDEYELSQADLELIASAIEESRERIPSPRGDKGLRKAKKGFVYSAYMYRDKVGKGPAHEEWLRTAKPNWSAFNPEVEDRSDLGSKRRLQFLFEIFRQISTWEGDTSSINTWDNQYLTIGAGFSGLATAKTLQKDGVRLVGKIYGLMPDAARQVLYGNGVRLNEDRTFSFFDTERLEVVRGNDALKRMRGVESIARTFVLLAQSIATAQKRGRRESMRQWMLESQFEVFCKIGTSKFPDGAEERYRSNKEISIAAFAAHMAHSGRFYLGKMLALGSLDQMQARALKAFGKGREEEIKRMASHHRNFYSKFPRLIP